MDRGQRTPIRPPRLLAQLWGTTSLGDCARALLLLAKRRELVEGPAIEAFEREVAARVGVAHGITFASGRVALSALLECLGVGDGDEVLLQVPTHIVVANAMRASGATPAYVDCTLDTLNMDLDHAARLVAPRTKVLLLQHTFGIPADMDRVLDFCAEHDLILIEDCVHALGATYQGREVGSFGRAAFYSTEETKVISSTVGGFAVTDDDELAAALVRFREKCAWPSRTLVARYLLKFVAYCLLGYPWVHPYTRRLADLLQRSAATLVAPDAVSEEEQRGELPDDYLQRFSNGQAAVALRQLVRIDENLEHRRMLADAFRDRIRAAGGHVPQPPAGADPAWVRYPVWVDDPDAATQAAARRVLLGRWFSSVFEEAESPAVAGYVPGSCPNAELAVRHLVNLPTHQRVYESEVDELVDLLVPYLVAPATGAEAAA